MPNRAHVELAGHVGNPPEIKANKAGKSFARFSIAVNTGTKEKPVTSWYQITASGYTFQQAKDLQKGDAVMVEGRMEFKKTEDGKGPYLNIWADLIAQFRRVENAPAAPPAEDEDEFEVPF